MVWIYLMIALGVMQAISDRGFWARLEIGIFWPYYLGKAAAKALL